MISDKCGLLERLRFESLTTHWYLSHDYGYIDKTRVLTRRKQLGKKTDYKRNQIRH